MLIPRRVKHRKQHHPDRSGMAKGGTTVTFGEWGIQALEPAYVTNRQIESARIAITRHIRRGGSNRPQRGGERPSRGTRPTRSDRTDAPDSTEAPAGGNTALATPSAETPGQEG